MRVLFDGCVDSRLARHLTGFATRTVHDLGWSGITNGTLLTLAQTQFDVLVTVDQNLSFQQHLPRYSIAVVLIHSPSNRLDDLITLVPEIVAAISSAAVGAVTHVGN